MNERTGVTGVSDFVLDLLFPRRCIGCGVEGDFLCSHCRELLPRPESAGVANGQDRDLLTSLDDLQSVFLYQGLAREAVHYLKYRNMKALARPLAQLMADYLESNPMPADVLTVVPMHSKRLRKRGYNQAELLARELSRLIQVPLVKGALARLRNTPSQVSMSASERRSNVEGAFQCRGHVFQGKDVLLIDDVCTTGATLNACAAALKEAGARSVQGLTLSREY